jgi:hypothetical protein
MDNKISKMENKLAELEKEIAEMNYYPDGVTTLFKHQLFEKKIQGILSNIYYFFFIGIYITIIWNFYSQVKTQ